MSGEFKEALEREIAELENSLARDPRFVKLRELERLAQLYSPVSETVAALRTLGSVITAVAMPRAFGNSVESPAPATDSQRRATSAIRQQVLEDTARILEGRTEPTKTAEIFDNLKILGHEIGGDDPKNNLSAMLSKSPLFQSHKRAGWTLVAPSDGEDEDEGVLGEQTALETLKPIDALTVLGPRGREHDL